MKKLLSTAMFLLSSTFLPGQDSGMFLNPVIRGDVADPSIIRFKGRYYATGTSSEWAPFYPLFESKNLVNWTQIGHVFDEKPLWASNSFWAPELFVSKGRVYCYYTARQEGSGISYIGVASAKSPRHEFTDHGPIVEYGTEAIDAFVFEDESRLYISWKAYGLDNRPIEILCCRLSEDGLNLDGVPFTVLRDDERIGMEGQYHFKRNGWYYIVYAARGCCGPKSDYEVRVARARTLRGPYEKYEGNPILRGDGEIFAAAGHGTVVETPDGRMFYMCHSYLTGNGFHRGRQPILQEIVVNENGWVEFAGGELVSARQQVPFAGTVQVLPDGFTDEFDGRRLKVDWTWNYPWADVEASVRKGKLTIGGGSFEGNGYGQALCLRPSADDYSYSTVVVENGSVAGLTMYGDAHNLVLLGRQHSKLFVKMADDGRETLLWEKDFGAEAVPAHLKIEVGQGSMLTFYYSRDGREWTRATDEALDRRALARWDRVARPGLIHIGDMDASAQFERFEMVNAK